MFYVLYFFRNPVMSDRESRIIDPVHNHNIQWFYLYRISNTTTPFQTYFIAFTPFTAGQGLFRPTSSLSRRSRPGPAFIRLHRAYVNDDYDTFSQQELMSEETISAELQNLGISMDSVPVWGGIHAASAINQSIAINAIANRSDARGKWRNVCTLAHLNRQNFAVSAILISRSIRLVSLSCGVCRTEAPLRRAVLVSCGHALCLACATQMRMDNGGTRIVCPFCRARSAFVALIEDHVDE